MLDLLKQGGVVMFPLGICSLITITILIERLWHFLRADRDPQAVIDLAHKALEQPEKKWLDKPSPSIRVVGIALDSLKASKHTIERRLENILASEGLRLNAHLGIVGTIGNISPFIGLFGTVLGIIKAFRDIGQVGAAGPAVVASGISEALVATAAGLFTAISAVIVYNFFIIWEKRILRRAEIVAGEMSGLLIEGQNHGN